MNEKRFIIIGGFHASGSSAVTDLLKEYDGFYECDAEIRFITDPYGIIQLERALVSDWDWIRSTVAIDDFLEYSKKCSRKKTFFPLAPFGMGYSKSISKDYYSITEQYVSKLTKFQYKQDFYSYKAKKNYLRYVIDRCRYGVEKYTNGKIQIANNHNCFFSHPTEEEFSDATKEYFNKLFERTTDAPNIILDQAVVPRDAEVIHKYFTDAKMIIVGRDPRDMFVNALKYEVKSHVTNSKKKGNEFAEIQKNMRSQVPTDCDILYVQFEDLIINYSREVTRIEDFLGLDEGKHTYKGLYLKPEESINNIGIWKKYYTSYKDTIDEIEKVAGEYLYSLD